MSLVTRCQVCATAFRVQPAQLSARGGKVRCGKCGAVFDGVAALVEEGTERLNLEPSPQLGLFDPSRRPAQAALSPHAGEATDEADLTVPEFLAREEPARRTWLWGALALLATAVLLAQAAHRYRTELAVIFPETRPALLAACRLAKCEIPLPRRAELMGIESSDLQAEPGSASIIVLNAVLRNRAPFPQEYPALELTLTDDGDKPVLRRVLHPGDYLDPARAGARREGLGPGAELSFRVNLDAGSARATGYRLYLFFPR